MLGSKAAAALKPTVSMAAPWKEERETGGGSTKVRVRVWIGVREQVIEQLLEAGTEDGVLL